MENVCGNFYFLPRHWGLPSGRISFPSGRPRGEALLSSSAGWLLLVRVLQIKKIKAAADPVGAVNCMEEVFTGLPFAAKTRQFRLHESITCARENYLHIYVH